MFFLIVNFVYVKALPEQEIVDLASLIKFGQVNTLTADWAGLTPLEIRLAYTSPPQKKLHIYWYKKRSDNFHLSVNIKCIMDIKCIYK